LSEDQFNKAITPEAVTRLGSREIGVARHE
jgi:hypothetical protein